MLVLSFTTAPAIMVGLELVAVVLVEFGDDCSVVTPPNMFHKG